MAPNMWVAVSVEYDGMTFSHRATLPESTPSYRAVHHYERMLDDAAGRVRRALTENVPRDQTAPGLSQWAEHEKLAEITRIVKSVSPGVRATALAEIEKVLDR